MAASQDGILSLDHENRITSWNRGASMLFGYATEEILGAPVARILPDFPEILAQGPDERKTWNVETTASGRGRRQITVDLTLTRIGAESGSMPVSLVVMRDITFRKERAAILEEERERISRDLHDGVAQTLYFLALKADVTREQLEADPDSARGNLREIGQQARNAIRDVRRAILGLRPMDWANGEFLAALAEFAVSFGHEVGLEVHLNPGDVGADIPSSLEPTLFRLVQESLNNVAKHAGARSVSIQFKPISERARLQVAIRDDGDGFAPDEITRGLGLSQMEQRVYAFGGEFEIVSRQGEGTEIRAEFPIEPARVAA
jgi:PAS domain S-box-containing protein